MAEEVNSLFDELDDGIRGVVTVLRSASIDTFSSCQGGGPSLGHHFIYPTVWFRGGAGEGKRAEMIVREAGYQVFHLSQVEYERQGERVGPFWELQFVPGAANTALPTNRITVQPFDMRAWRLYVLQAEGLADWTIQEHSENYCWANQKIIQIWPHATQAIFLHEVAHAKFREPEGEHKNHFHGGGWADEFSRLVTKYLEIRRSN